MKRTVRAGTALVLGLGLAGVGSSAFADDVLDGCAEGDDGYVGGGVCELEVSTEALCLDDVPYLDYSLSVNGAAGTTATVRWQNPSGGDVVLANQPLEGRLLWPNGSWARPTVDVTFEVNPDATVTVAYPAATEDCGDDVGGVLDDEVTPTSNQQPLASDGDVLAATGFPTGLVAGGAAGLAVAGAVLVAVARRRQGHENA